MNNALTGIMLGLTISLVGMASQPGEIPRPKGVPQYAQLTNCEDRILYRLNFYSELLVQRQAPYVWGGLWGLLGGDCSGQIYWICKMAGLPVKRTTSFRMWLDKGSWPGERVLVKAGALERAQFPDLGFLTYSPKRPRGHVVMVILNALDKDGNQRILFREASSSKKIFKETAMKKGDYRWVQVLWDTGYGSYSRF